MLLVVIAAISLVISLAVFFACFGKIAQIYWIAVVFAGSFLGLILLWALPVIICSFFVDLKKPNRKHSPFFRFYADCLIDLAIRLMRIKIHVIGREKLPKEKFLLVGNHLSYFDPGVAMLALRSYRMAFVGATELLYRFPVLKKIGHKVFCVPIDRQSARDGVRMVNEAAEIISSQLASIGIYPEGRRNLEGGELLPFKNGAFKIAKKANCPIVIALIKNIDKIKNNLPFRRTHVYLEFVDVIKPEEIAGYTTQEISELVREKLEEKLN